MLSERCFLRPTNQHTTGSEIFLNKYLSSNRTHWKICAHACADDANAMQRPILETLQLLKIR